jgi:hypothetical protein
MPVSQNKEAVVNLIKKINSASPAEIAAQSDLPFLFDAEPVVLEGDLDILWSNLREAGFTLDPVSAGEAGAVAPSDYGRFGDSFEIRAFFSQYVDESASIIDVQSSAGHFILLLQDEKNGLPMIKGMRGPLQ